METTVSRVIFDGTHATGVEYLPSDGGDVSTVSASKEVIVASGALHTPGVLQRSGIGAKAVLSSLGIEVISDLPGVGSNFQDQTTVHVPLNLTKNLSPNANSINIDAEYNATEWAAYQAHLPSAYTLAHNLSTTFTGVSLQDLISSSVDNSTIITAAATYNAADSLPVDVDATVLAGYKAQREVLLKEITNSTLSVGFLYFDTFSSAEAYLMKPFSRGNVHINSTDPLAQPVIDYGTATDPADIALNAALLGKLREVVAAPAMQALGPIAEAPFGDDVVTEEQIVAALRENLIISNAHQCCTAPMMPLELGGVVGPDKKVYGVTGLRVGDISTFPTAVSGGPTGTVYGAAEKLADIIKKEWSTKGYYS
ncbi:hypothetical protein N8I77_005124 [Diaporthe amygdali]|uniref:Glucose-methanol-choline oxidoreductase N-terminal domain-containing protein n=1 Tax=Phomopsis amygdali TaxID=1214568 RepID=A0AAD9W7S6_PHOAM|nr:hypothetical protein N8I77_005124 [Diaporthe amygdali]